MYGVVCVGFVSGELFVFACLFVLFWLFNSVVELCIICMVLDSLCLVFLCLRLCGIVCLCWLCCWLCVDCCFRFTLLYGGGC